MKQFKPNNIEPVDILGNEYIIDVTNVDMLDKLEENKDTLTKRLKALQGSRDMQAVKDFVQVMIEFFDIVLGEGEGKKVWDLANHSLNVGIEVLTFLSELVTEQKSINAERYLKK